MKSGARSAGKRLAGARPMFSSEYWFWQNSSARFGRRVATASMALGASVGRTRMSSGRKGVSASTGAL